jgi:hypothetical protein
MPKKKKANDGQHTQEYPETFTDKDGKWDKAYSDSEWDCGICGKPIRPGTEFYANEDEGQGKHFGCVNWQSIQPAQVTFGLEHDLQIALRDNIEQVEKGLRIIDRGKEQKVDSGFIDITAEDHKGTTVVIELKAETADRESVAQILSYMGDLSQGAKPARGILIAGNFATRAISAARAVPNLQLHKYGFKFTFEKVSKEKKKQ